MTIKNPNPPPQPCPRCEGGVCCWVADKELYKCGLCGHEMPRGDTPKVAPYIELPWVLPLDRSETVG